MSKKIGIIGGLGPLATVKLIELLDKKIKDVKYIVINDPTTPDRTKYILNESKEDPSLNIISMVKKIEKQKVDVFTMPCNTASYFYEKIKGITATPFVNIVEETANFVSSNNFTKVGLLCTEGTIRSGIYENRLKSKGIEVVFPDKNDQTIINSIIYDEVKANKKISVDKFNIVVNNLKNSGVSKIILGCTELSVIYEQGLINDESLIDAMEVVADKINEILENN